MRPVSMSTSAMNSPVPRTTASRLPGHEADAGHLAAVRDDRERPARGAAAPSVDHADRPVLRDRAPAAGRRRSARRPPALGPPASTGRPSRRDAGEVPDEDRAVEAGGVERPPVARDLRARRSRWRDPTASRPPPRATSHTIASPSSLVVTRERPSGVKRAPVTAAGVTSGRPAHVAGPRGRRSAPSRPAPPSATVRSSGLSAIALAGCARRRPRCARRGFSVRASRDRPAPPSATVSTRRPSRVASTASVPPAERRADRARAVPVAEPSRRRERSTIGPDGRRAPGPLATSTVGAARESHAGDASAVFIELEPRPRCGACACP